MAVFDRGDIVRVRLDPVEGHEMRGDSRPALVLTTRDFNRLGDVLVAPITQGGDFSRFAGFAVSLTGTGCKTQGGCTCEQDANDGSDHAQGKEGRASASGGH